MTLKVNGKSYEVVLNGTDYVSQKEPDPGDFGGTFDVEIDGVVEHGMTLAGIQELEDGWHISLYRQTEEERLSAQMKVLAEVTAQAVDDDTAEKIPDLLPPWSGDGVKYEKDFRARYEGLSYRCIQPHTSQPDWTPKAAVSLWVRTANPGEEWPEWIQPTGGHDAYAQGAKVSHNGKHWISDVDNNVWEPGVYGWTEA